MAASGGNIEWSTTIKPILTALYGPFFDKNDAAEIIQSIIKSENEFQNHAETYDLFYTCFACLSAHFITVNANNLTADQLGAARDALRVILRQILKKLSEAGLNYEETTTTTAATNVSVKQLLLPIVGLCGIEGGGYPQLDLVILTSLLKSAKLPTHVTVPDTPATSTMQTTGAEKQPPSTQRRSDALLEQLTTPLKNTAPHTQAVSPAAANDSVEPGKDPQQAGVDMKKWLSSTAAALLMELRAGSVILKVCSSLPCLQRYLNRWQTAKETAVSPQFHSDVSLQHFLVNEVHVCRLALSLPCLEPFTPERIVTLSDVSTAWLLCATAQASIHPKDEESEQQTATSVESALSLLTTVGDTFRESTRAGGYVYQNHLMIGSWVLLCGLHHALAGAPLPTATPGKSPAKTQSRPYNLTKMQQGLGAVWVALGGRCLEWLGALLSDARMEFIGDGAAPAGSPAALSVLGQHTAHQRELRLASAAPLHQLLVTLGVVCYRKATNLKRTVVQKQNAEADPDRSDSTVYFQDMTMCSEDSETDDDSELLFGLWFESTLAAANATETSSVTRPGGADGTDSAETSSRPHQALVPDKSEPYSYIRLATEVFNLLTAEIISESSERLGQGALQLHDAHQALLAALVKDLDRETARTDTGTISPCFGPRICALYSSFSSALIRYLHNLISAPSFASLQPALQQQLTFGGAERGNNTPLQVGPRVLKLLGGMVLSKPAAERENTILAMWHKIVNTLQDCALQGQPSQDHDYEDLNVEHAQLLVYLFHSLTLMQKKSVLLMTSNAIIKVVETLAISDRKRAMTLAPHQLILTTRLMLLLEYLMRHLYDAPQTLLQQIEWNLVIATGLVQSPSDSSQAAKMTTEGGQMKTRIYCEVPNIEDAYRRQSLSETAMRPKFYALTNSEINNQENPKFDGLACNFVLGTPHKLKYPLLLDALLSLLNSACVCDNPASLSSPSALAAAHYCFQTAWRLVVSMPPATPHMDKLQAGMQADLPSPLPLHAIIWAPRADNKKVFNPWLKDALVKQGMYTQYAENLLSGVSTSCDNIKYHLWLACETIKHLKDNITPNGLPSLLDVISCDAALVRLKHNLAESASALDVQEFLPELLHLLETLFDCCRLSADLELDGMLESSNNPSKAAVRRARMMVCGTNSPAIIASNTLGCWLSMQLPSAAAAALERLCSPPAIATANLDLYASHIIPLESAVLALVASHCELISANAKYSIGPSLMALTYSAAKLLEVSAAKIAENPNLMKRTLDLVVPALTDGRLQFMSPEPMGATLNILVPQEQKAVQLIHEHILRTTYPVLVDHLQRSTEKTLRHMVNYWDRALNKTVGRLAYENVFADETEFVLAKILLSAPNARTAFAEKVIELFIKIFTGCENSELSSSLCISVCRYMGIADQQKLSALLAYVCHAVGSTNRSANASPAETELPTPTSTAPEAGQSSIPFGKALRTVFVTGSHSRAERFTTGKGLGRYNRDENGLVHRDEPNWEPEGAATSRVLFGKSLADNGSRATEGGASSRVFSKSLYLPPRCRESDPPRAGADSSDTRAADPDESWVDSEKEKNVLAAETALLEAAEDTILLTEVASDNAALLTALCKHIVIHCDESVSERMLATLISVCGDNMCAPLLMREMCRLADAHSGADHKQLFPAAVGWLATCFNNLSAPEVLEKLEEGQVDDALAPEIESACVLLSYLADALHSINNSQQPNWRSVSPTWEAPYDLGFDLDCADEQQDEDDTSADDSDEDAMLQYKLCTFTVTQREFMNQHWYHCHTCKMVDGVGVCTVCARVCHRGHDVSYAKFGNFFCDCGAKPDSSCQALVKRSVTLGGARSGGAEEPPPAPSIRRRPSSPLPPALLAPPRRPVLAANIQGVTLTPFVRHWQPAAYERVRRRRAAPESPAHASNTLRLSFRAHNRDFTLLLKPDTSSVFAEGAQFHSSAGPLAYTAQVYTGKLADDDSSEVYGVITADGLFDGTIWTATEEYYVEPLSRYDTSHPSMHSVVYRRSDVDHPHDNQPTLCASHQLHLKRQQGSQAELFNFTKQNLEDSLNNTEDLTKEINRRKKRWLPDEEMQDDEPKKNPELPLDLDVPYTSNSDFDKLSTRKPKIKIDKSNLITKVRLDSEETRPSKPKTHVEVIKTKAGVVTVSKDIVKKEPVGYTVLTGNGTDDGRHVNKRATVDPRKTTCLVYLQADHMFYQRYGSEEACIEVMTRHVQKVNAIYKVTDFNQDGKPDNITFMIKRIKVHTLDAMKDPAYRFPNNYGVEKYLELFSEEDYDAFCLAYMFTYRDFEMGTLGLAWTGDLKNAGGVCEKNGHYRGSMKSLNTGIVTLLNYGKHVPPAVSHVTLAHEIGHNFGSPHDPEVCTPFGEDGNYIMFARATSGDRKNNNKFSPCSLRAIDPVLNNKARSPKGCFTEPQPAICGNGVVEEGEECDCGWASECTDVCCRPQAARPHYKPCTLTEHSVCSPSQGPCCTASCTLKFGDKCRSDNGCRDAAHCDGKRAACPASRHKPNRTRCDKELVCFMGECTGSICLAYGLESCQCAPRKDDPRSACELCCRKPGGACVSSFHWNTAPFDVPDMYAKPGTPCNDYNGYCDVFQRCREVDPSGPLATLRKLLLSDESIAGFKRWVLRHWYAVLLILLAVVALLVASTRFLGRHGKKLKSVTIIHSSTTETVRLPDAADPGGLIVHTAVRSKLPLKKKVALRTKAYRNKKDHKNKQGDKASPAHAAKKRKPSHPAKPEEAAKVTKESTVVVTNAEGKSPKHMLLSKHKGKIKKRKSKIKKETIDYSSMQKHPSTPTKDTEALTKVQKWLLSSPQPTVIPKSKSIPLGLTERTHRQVQKGTRKTRPSKSATNLLSGEKARLQVVFKPPFRFSVKICKSDKTKVVLDKSSKPDLDRKRRDSIPQMTSSADHAKSNPSQNKLLKHSNSTKNDLDTATPTCPKPVDRSQKQDSSHRYANLLPRSASDCKLVKNIQETKKQNGHKKSNSMGQRKETTESRQNLITQEDGDYMHVYENVVQDALVPKSCSMPRRQPATVIMRQASHGHLPRVQVRPQRHSSSALPRSRNGSTGELDHFYNTIETLRRGPDAGNTNTSSSSGSSRPARTSRQNSLVDKPRSSPDASKLKRQMSENELGKQDLRGFQLVVGKDKLKRQLSANELCGSRVQLAMPMSAGAEPRQFCWNKRASLDCEASLPAAPRAGSRRNPKRTTYTFGELKHTVPDAADASADDGHVSPEEFLKIIDN